MNYFDLYSSFPDRTIAAAWDSQVKEADNTPWLAGTLTECGGELFMRFAACYAELRALPRGARRALQRRIARSSELAAIFPEKLLHGGRRLQHRMAWTLAGAALLLALSQGIATAATITVTTNNPDIISDGQCSLIEAIVNANNDAATHADCPAGSGADTIVLPANANITLSAVFGNAYGQFGNAVGLPPITSQITIEGNGATIARQAGAPAFRLIAVRGNFPQPPMPGNLTLRSVTLSGGSFGGVSNSFGGTLTIQNSIISGNTGRGVSNSGTLAIENTTISNNTSGGIFNSGTLSIKKSTISGNTAYSHGGGVDNYYGTATIENSTISGNLANRAGGGVSNYAGNLTITNSTISGNLANHGGGVSNSPGCYYGPPCTDGTLTLNNSLIAGNQAFVAPEVENTSILAASNFNLFGTNGNTCVTGFLPGPSDIVPTVPLAQILGPLQNNGGPTQTHALLVGSPAIDEGDPGGCRDNLGALLLTDQRGFPRPFNGQICDIGSYEFQGSNSGAVNVALPADTTVSDTCPSLPPLTIGTTTVATGEAGVSFTSDLMISGGVAPYVVSIIKGKLPVGLSLGNDGIISGTISPAARSEKVTVRITESLNQSITQTFTITVLKAVHIVGKPKTGRVGKDYSSSFRTRGGLGPFNWSITSGALPPDLSFNSATGALTGIPTQGGEFPLTVQVTDALGGVDVETLTLKIR